jgi:small nuclear ribonucleoprotein (snRNP)-like protein
MAASSQMASSGALDVLSPNFDAGLALRSNRIQLPHKVAALDNLHKARGLLPPSHPHFSAYTLLDRHKLPRKNANPNGPIAEAGASAASADADASRREQRRSKIEQDEQYSNVMLALAENTTEGPMMVLKKAFDSRKRVKIWTRGIGGVRGTCIGFIKAFDRHMNLLLFDVDET